MKFKIDVTVYFSLICFWQFFLFKPGLSWNGDSITPACINKEIKLYFQFFAHSLNPKYFMIFFSFFLPTSFHLLIQICFYILGLQHISKSVGTGERLWLCNDSQHLKVLSCHTSSQRVWRCEPEWAACCCIFGF